MEWVDRVSDLVVEEVVRVPWIKGAKAFLDKYSSKLPVFVISGTPETELKYVVDQRKMSHYFKEVLGSPGKIPPYTGTLCFHRRCPDRL